MVEQDGEGASVLPGFSPRETDSKDNFHPRTAEQHPEEELQGPLSLHPLFGVNFDTRCHHTPPQ